MGKHRPWARWDALVFCQETSLSACDAFVPCGCVIVPSLKSEKPHAPPLATELAADTVTQYLVGRGLLPAGAASVEELGGGVSSRVFLVASNRRRLVVKQPLPRFRVRDEWLVDTDRITVEANFLRHIGSRLPSGSLPEFVLFDEPEQVLVVTAAPPHFRPWKTSLLAGDADPRLAQAAGALLGKIHRIGIEDPTLRSTFEQSRLFDQQRVDPYLRTLVTRHPKRAPALRNVIAHLENDRTTLIHGDFSPKNMLTDARALLLVDHEVATWNDPLFDVSFFLNHLVLKFAHLEGSEAIAECVHGFLDAYAAAAPPIARERLQQPSHLLPALMLARVDGKSPVEYLKEPARDEVRTRAGKWLDAPPRPLTEYVSKALVA